jgi:hypothetical protein
VADETDDDEAGRAEFAALRDRMIDLVAEAVRGTEWGPPDDDPAVLSEIVVVMGWTKPSPGRYASSYLRSGSTWSSKGLMRETLDAMEAADDGSGSGYDG